MKILVLSHALAQRASQERWRRLAASNPNLHIRLLVPRRWITRAFNSETVFQGWDENIGNFEVRALDTISKSNHSYYLFRGLAQQFREFNPDVIFPTHESFQTLQTILWHRVFARSALLVFFTMSVHPRIPSLRSIHPRRVLGHLRRVFSWWMVCHGTDAAICHYPEIERQLRLEGYQRPILVQTQIGVDENLFCPNPLVRTEVRAELAFDGFIVGFAGRITAEKGILDIASAIGGMPEDVHLLVVGDGSSRAELEALATRAGWRNRLHLTGYVGLNDVARYMQAMDCLVLGSRTIEGWTDTFPLVVAQAMATGLPVVASKSGAIPFQLGGLGLLFNEGDIETLCQHLLLLRANQDQRSSMSNTLRTRALQEFCIGGINPTFYNFVRSLQR